MITKKEMVCYNTDASRLIGNTEKVVFPKTVKEVQKIVKTSNLDIVPRGAGSERVGGVIPNNSIVVDMSKMNEVLNFDALKRTVCVQVGITIRELNERLNKIGFEFPIQTNNKGISSIGGMIALNQIGNRSMKYGKMKDWVEEIEFIDGKGELIKLSKSDMMDICGMEGITGIITSALLKIIPKIKRSISIFQSEDINEIFSVLRRLKLEKEICSLNLFPPKVSELLELPEKYHIIIEFDSERGKIKGEEYDFFSKINDKVYFSLAFEEYYFSEDSWFFLDKLKDFALFLEKKDVPYFSKIGAGIIYYFFKDNEKEKKQEVIQMMNRMGGKVGEYGIGLTRKHLKEDVEKKVIGRIKMRHDPFKKMNMNKVIDANFKTDLSFESKSKPSLSGVGHLKLIEKEEIEEIKFFIEEKDSFESIEEIEDPEEKMEAFIEKVELINKFEPDLDLKPKQEDSSLQQAQDSSLQQAQDYEVRTRLKDYESTYKSELEDENKKKIEEFAKNIAHDLVHPRHPIAEVEKRAMNLPPSAEEEPKIVYPSERRGKLTKEEEDEIKRIMFGGSVKKEEKTENKE
jgi:FAD/FMN-containing dehydrogenase